MLVLELFHPFVELGKLKSWALRSVSEDEHGICKRELAFGCYLTFPWPLLSLEQCHRFQLCNVLCVPRGALGCPHGCLNLHTGMNRRVHLQLGVK